MSKSSQNAQNPMLISNQRLAVIAGLFVLLGLVIAVRSLYVGTVQAGQLADKARENPTSRVVELAPRGRVLDRRGELLAVSHEATRVEVDWHALTVTHPSIITPLAQQLSIVLDRPVETLRKQLIAVAQESTGTRQTAVLIEPMLSITKTGELTRALQMTVPLLHVSSNAYAPLSDFVRLSPTFKREYPQGTLAGAIVGAVRHEAEHETGAAGIELQYDDVLRAEAGVRKSLGLDRTVTPTVPGSDLVLTIDGTLQRFAEKKLLDALNKYSGSGGVIIVMDTQTGAIYAMASRETAKGWFDPAAASKALAAGKNPALGNMALIDASEPGSVVKPLTVLTTVEFGKLRPVYVDNGVFKVQGGPPVTNLDGASWKSQDVVGALAHSVNTIMAMMATDVGPGAFYPQMRKYGFTQQTGIDLPGEGYGLMRQPDKPATLAGSPWMQSDMARDSFGQSMIATPIQVLAAMNVIANDGVWIKPHVVREVRHADGTMDVTQPASGTQAARPESARKTREFLAAATNAVIVAGKNELAIKGFPYAGKTGTADRIVHVTDTTLTIYAGMIPAGQPRLTILVKINDPRGATLAGAVAMPVWRDVAEYAVQLFGISPEK